MEFSNSYKSLLWKTTQLKRDRYELLFTTRIKAVLNKQFRELAGKIDSDNYRDEHLVDTITKEPIEKALTDLYKIVGVAFARDQLNRLKSESQGMSFKEAEEDVWSESLTNYLKINGGKRIISITGETKKQALKIIRPVLNDAIDQGLGADQTARAVRKALVNEGININQWRALRIARTEVMTASNIGTIEGARATNQPMTKYWISTYDDRTRDTHRNVESQNPLQMDDKFQVGEYQMDVPGDPAGGAEEVINCRCTVAFRVEKI